MRSRIFFCMMIFQFFAVYGSSQALGVVNLRCEYRVDPLGVEMHSPYLSWQLLSTKKDVLQTAYRILVSNSLHSLENNIGDVWNSGKVYTDSSIQIVYQGKPLKAAKTYYWKVEIWDNRHDSSWSSTASWQMGLFSESNWEGSRWIAYKQMPDSDGILPGEHFDKRRQRNDILPLMRKGFSIDKSIKRATVFISGLGQFELYLNGKKTGEHFLDPGWTQYTKEALYVTFDITKMLHQGNNVIGAMLGNGFYYIPVWQHRYRKLTLAYGYPEMKCMVRLEYTDGSVGYIISDSSWKCARGPILFSSIYGGEDYNANLEQPGWNKAGFNDTNWKNAVVVKGPPELHSQIEYPVKIFNHFYPKKISYIKNGDWVYDLGQNASGIPDITLDGHKGDTVRIIPGEVINKKDGSVSQRGSGGPFYFTYVLNGSGKETWHPRFSYYGFRYLQMEGAVPEGKPNPKHLPVMKNLQGWHIRNAAPRIGSFRCSNELFNRIYKLIDWAIQSNMVSIFTDCPTREKLGWLEEVNLMGSSIHYNYDVPDLFRRTIINMEEAQTSAGLVPEIAPEYSVFTGDFRDSPEWGSSSVIVPWFMYKWYGDKQILAQSYSMMRRYVKYLEDSAKNYILYFGLSDWYDLGPGREGFSQLTPKGVTATAYFYDDLNIMQKVAAILNKPDDVSYYKKLSEKVKNAFNKMFFHENTKEYATGSQTANAMAVYTDLVPSRYKTDVINNIVKDIHQHDNTFTSGDVGFRYLLKALDKPAHSELIFKMNNRTDVPGYGYQLKHGATALTESWNASPSASNDHLMLGDLMEWFYDGIGGISQTDSSVAYHQIKIAPEPVGNITSAYVSFVSPYGPIVSQWEKHGDIFKLKVVIPANTTAIVEIPVGPGQNVTDDGKQIKDGGITLMNKEKNKMYIRTGSGEYTFIAK